MEKFNTLRSVAIPMPTPNIDTDQLIPKQFLKIVRRTGLGDHLLFDQRYDANGAPIKGFVLNQKTYHGGGIIVAGDNFGCGSSREHAVWALSDFGVRCVISTSFSDIFYNNAVENGLLAARVSAEHLAVLQQRLRDDPGAELTVDLQAQLIKQDNFDPISFQIGEYEKGRLLAGLDKVTQILQFNDDIVAYEKSREDNDAAFVPTSL